MRNLFDQYEQHENRVTHALISCLEADRALLQRFIKWSVGPKVDARRLAVLEQSLPGDPLDITEEEAERRGLPDACFWDKNKWALVIEAKVKSDVSVDQLRRHARTVARRGIEECVILVLTAKPIRQRLDPAVHVKQWSDVYKWLQEESPKTLWARRCKEYLELVGKDLDEGSLTVFAGIPFSQDEPYNYPQAKRLLGLLRAELMKDRRLVSQLGMDPESKGRPAITGRAGGVVWDYIGFAQARQHSTFTSAPHLTLGILDDKLEVYVTFPNSMRGAMRSNMLGDSYEHFEELIRKVTEGMMEVTRSVPDAAPRVFVVQRHYKSQRSEPSMDCVLNFDPRTAVSVKQKGVKRVKAQPQWLRATYDALQSRRSNLQFQIGMEFRYDACPEVAKPGIARVCADVWLACRPLLSAVLKG